jgi:hypothetical protein
VKRLTVTPAIAKRAARKSTLTAYESSVKKWNELRKVPLKYIVDVIQETNFTATCALCQRFPYCIDCPLDGQFFCSAVDIPKWLEGMPKQLKKKVDRMYRQLKKLFITWKKTQKWAENAEYLKTL